MSHSKSILAEQFDDLAQQKEASHLGMWTFLATEIMFFGGLFLAYITYRHTYYDAFVAGSNETNLLYGTVNTAILLTSSLTMALAVHAAEAGRTKHVVRFLLVTLFFAVGFLAVKGLEYHEDITKHLVPRFDFKSDLPKRAELFFYLYWVMTGLHALHVTVGVGIISVMAWLAAHRRFSTRYYNPVEVAGLYWHFVDIVWIFLYPLLYLVGRHS